MYRHLPREVIKISFPTGKKCTKNLKVQQSNLYYNLIKDTAFERDTGRQCNTTISPAASNIRDDETETEFLPIIIS